MHITIRQKHSARAVPERVFYAEYKSNNALRDCSRNINHSLNDPCPAGVQAPGWHGKLLLYIFEKKAPGIDQVPLNR